MKIDESVSEVADRWKVVEKMNLATQYAFAGDFTGMRLSGSYLSVHFDTLTLEYSGCARESRDRSREV